MKQENIPGIPEYDIGSKVKIEEWWRSEDGVYPKVEYGTIASFTVGRKKVVVDLGHGEYKLVAIADITVEVDS